MMTPHDCALERVVVPGTFDPITLGHLDVIRRAARLAPQVIIAVAASVGKGGVGTAFTLEERVALVEASVREAGLEVSCQAVPLTGLLVDFCREHQARAVVKGLRAATDFEYELAQADCNYKMAPWLESVFIMSAPEYGFVSSSIVREIASLGGDVSSLVSACVQEALAARSKG
jgi:pantetheine-phosphate adenylyltransferase